MKKTIGKKLFIAKSMLVLSGLCAALATVNAQEPVSASESETAINARIKTLTAKIASAPKNDQLYVERGKAYDELQKYDLAIKDAETALRINPQNKAAQELKDRAELSGLWDNLYPETDEEKASTTTREQFKSSPVSGGVSRPPVAFDGGTENAKSPIGGSNPAAPQTDEIANYLAGLKKNVIEKGGSFVSEGIGNKISAFATNLSSRLSIDASSNRHFVLFVISDDPTYDTFFYLNGQFMNTPVQMSGYYVKPPKVTKLSDTYTLFAFTMGFNNESRSVTAEFRGDKSGKVRYLLVQIPGPQDE